jgi:CHAT domain-containing protein
VFEVIQYSVHDCGVLDAGDHLDGAGEGVYGLRRALVLAGVESQVMSLWKVDDQATKHLMVEYYRRLMSGQGRSQALRQVQLVMLHSKRWSHPYYWASFI